MEPLQIVIISFLVVFSLVIRFSIRYVPHDYLFIVERFGKYHRTLSTGLYFLYPFYEKVVGKVPLKEQSLNIHYNNQEILIKYIVIDGKAYTYGAKNINKTLSKIVKDVLNNNELSIIDSVQTKVNDFGIKINTINIK